MGHDALDVEFAFTQDSVPNILQVRPIAVGHIEVPEDDLIEAGIAGARRNAKRSLARPTTLPALFLHTSQLALLARHLGATDDRLTSLLNCALLELRAVLSSASVTCGYAPRASKFSL